jgi:hypothetical protein
MDRKSFHNPTFFYLSFRSVKITIFDLLSVAQTYFNRGLANKTGDYVRANGNSYQVILPKPDFDDAIIFVVL